MSNRRTTRLSSSGWIVVCFCLLSPPVFAEGVWDKKDVFNGKLFAPNLILEHKDALGLTREQFTAIRQAVVEVQGGVAGHEWDLREAYARVLSNLDKSPVDADEVMENVSAALAAENQVKQMQVRMLITLRNLLTDEQIEYLRAQRKK